VQFPITIGLHRSRILNAALLLLTVLATWVWLLWPQTFMLRLIGAVLIVATSWFIRRQLEPTLGCIRLDRAGNIFASTGLDGEFKALYAQSGAMVHPWLTVVRFRDDLSQRYTLVATIDSMNPNEFRRLRLFLRWRVKFAEQASDA